MSTGSAAPKKRASYWHLLKFLDTVQHERNSISNVAEGNVETTVDIEEGNSFLPESEEGDALFSESQHAETSGATSGNKFPSNRKLKRPFDKVGESSSPTEGVQTKIKKVSNKQEIVTLLKKSAEDRVILKKYLQQTIEPEKEHEIDAFLKSIGLTIKKFDEEMQAEVKNQIFNLVSKYEIMHIRQNNTPPTIYSPLSHQSHSSDVLVSDTQGDNGEEEPATYLDLTNFLKM